jgi:sporulation protein YlmC with PRC-barrel domain
MRSRTRRSLAIGLAVAMIGFSSSIWADHTQPEIVKGSKIIGKSVQTMSGEEIGEIADLAIDELDGQVRYAVLSFGGIFGMGGKYFAIPWEALHLSDNKEHFALAVTAKELAKAPGFDKNNWPDFADPVYYATIYEFYHMPVPQADGGSKQKVQPSTPQDSDKMGQSKKTQKETNK